VPLPNFSYGERDRRWRFEALIGHKAFDNNWLRADLKERGAAAVILC
jgi:hypothetical protein